MINIKDKFERLGEKNININGNNMKIITYNGADHIDILFTDYDWISYNKSYQNFKKGSILCPYDRTVLGFGYLGIGGYSTNNKINSNGKIIYHIWNGIIDRCYKYYTDRNHVYNNAKLCREWHCFNTFAIWYNENYYEIEGKLMCVDKDILIKGNKIYSPENCVFVPQNINKLFTKTDALRGDYPIGVSYDKAKGKYKSTCNDGNKKSVHLGFYCNPIIAFNTYKQYKEKLIKRIADSVIDKIPKNLYDAMYNYKVEITD